MILQVYPWDSQGNTNSEGCMYLTAQRKSANDLPDGNSNNPNDKKFEWRAE